MPIFYQSNPYFIEFHKEFKSFCSWENVFCKMAAILSLTVSTHWGRRTHLCVSKLTNIGSDNGLSPSRRQAIIWTNAGILLTGPLETNFSEIFIKIHIISFKKMLLKVLSGEWQPFCLSLIVLNTIKPLCVNIKSLVEWNRYANELLGNWVSLA